MVEHLDERAALGRRHRGQEVGLHLPEFAGRRFPLHVVMGFHLLDTLVHGWDVAATLGIDATYDDDLRAAAHTQARLVPAGDARTAPGAPFAPVLASADETTGWAHTLALLGRDPRWTHATAMPGS